MFRRLWNLMCVLCVAALVLAACGPAATPEPAEEFVFGVILVGPFNDHGWSEAHYTAAEYVTEKLPNTRFVYLDKLNPADRPETTLEQAVDDMVSQGAKVVFTTSDDFKEDTDLAAEKYSDVTFIHISGDHVLTGDAPPNVDNYMGKMPYGKMIAGCAAALTTQTGSIGYLGPLINDETRRLVNSAYLGARYCMDEFRGGGDLTFAVNWIGFWFNIPGFTLDPGLVVNDFFDGGADVVLSGIDTTEAIVIAGQRAAAGESVWAVPYDYKDACAEATEACLGTPYFNWGPAYLDVVKSVIQDDFTADWKWLAPNWDDINDPDSSAVGWVFGDGLSADAKTDLETFIAGLADGSINLYTGPLFYQDGSTYLADGVEATDFQIWYTEQLLQGIDGASS
jgi:simple sugar transport system substrate-binding protein